MSFSSFIFGEGIRRGLGDRGIAGIQDGLYSAITWVRPLLQEHPGIDAQLAAYPSFAHGTPGPESLASSFRELIAAVQFNTSILCRTFVPKGRRVEVEAIKALEVARAESALASVFNALDPESRRVLSLYLHESQDPPRELGFLSAAVTLVPDILSLSGLFSLVAGNSLVAGFLALGAAACWLNGSETPTGIYARHQALVRRVDEVLRRYDVSGN